MGTELLRRDLKFGASVPKQATAPPQDGEDDGEWASVALKLRLNKPKPWTGKTDYVVREAWIKTAESYLVGIGIHLDSRFSRARTPLPYYQLRGLFSANKAPNRSAPVAWFDQREKDGDFQFVKDVFNLMRRHWHDDFASDRALKEYRNLSQAKMRAREFAIVLNAAADAVTDYTIPDADRRHTFLAGLNTKVSDFVKAQMATNKMVDPTRNFCFDDLVTLAARTDELA